MKHFLIDYGGTAVVLILLALIVFLAIRKIVKDRKNGKSGCSCGCENCAFGKTCKK